jgi:hypothetical protein
VGLGVEVGTSQVCSLNILGIRLFNAYIFNSNLAISTIILKNTYCDCAYTKCCIQAMLWVTICVASLANNGGQGQ